MKDLFKNFRQFTENTQADALKKAMKNLGMNVDTATAPKPEKPKRVMPRRLEQMLEDRGFYINRFLDEGKYGKVWEIEGSNSGRRLAVKVVSVLLGGQQVDTEEKNYRWILENRASLPDEVKQHLVNVYSVDRIPGEDIVDPKRGQPYQMSEGALVIICLLYTSPSQRDQRGARLEEGG